MASGFTLSLYPWIYTAQYMDDETWSESYTEKSHVSVENEENLGPAERYMLNIERNNDSYLPLVNYTSQYGFGCFEGLKAYPQPDSSLKIFRPDENATRMYCSMEGLNMPAFPRQMFTKAVSELVGRNWEIGYYPRYDPSWEKRGFIDGHSVYVRPFTYSEPGIGLNISRKPWVVIITTPVGSYFDPDARAKATTTRRVRANEYGTGWIKCNANYVIPILAKHEAQQAGYMEAIFLDAKTSQYVEEGSSCNIFFYLRDGTLVTPDLQDRILPGINRKSIITLARDRGVEVQERPITIDEALDNATETFVTGTAAGVAHIESITHEGRTVVYNNAIIGDLTRELRDTLKGIQYGALEDSHLWMKPVAAITTASA